MLSDVNNSNASTNTLPDGEPSAETNATRTELWQRIAVLTIGFVLLEGFGAYQTLYVLSPTRYLILASVGAGTAMLCAPRGVLRRCRLPKSVVLYCAWITVSFLWTSYQVTWVKIAGRDLLTIAVVLILGQMLSATRFLNVLLHTGYCAIGLIGVSVVLVPSRAYSATEGLRGGFVHKSPMGAALTTTLALALCIEPRRWVRMGLIPVTALVLVLGHTTTGVAAFMLALSLIVPLRHFAELRSWLGRAFGTLVFGAIVVFGAGYVVMSDALIGLYGKDLTFSSRTVIWKGVLLEVAKRRLLGYGWTAWDALWLEPSSVVIRTAGFPVAESHNTAFELLLRVGAIGLLLYLIVVAVALRASLGTAAVGDRGGVFGVTLIGILCIWGFSESLVVGGAWVGIFAVLALGRPFELVPLPPSELRRLGAPKAVNLG